MYRGAARTEAYKYDSEMVLGGGRGDLGVHHVQYGDPLIQFDRLIQFHRLSLLRGHHHLRKMQAGGISVNICIGGRQGRRHTSTTVKWGWEEGEATWVCIMFNMGIL